MLTYRKKLVKESRMQKVAKSSTRGLISDWTPCYMRKTSCCDAGENVAVRIGCCTNRKQWCCLSYVELGLLSRLLDVIQGGLKLTFQSPLCSLSLSISFKWLLWFNTKSSPMLCGRTGLRSGSEAEFSGARNETSTGHKMVFSLT